MKRITYPVLIACLFMPAALAADFDGKKTLICANVNISECVPEGKCEVVTAASIQASNLLKVDFKNKIVGGMGEAASRPSTKIEQKEITNGKIYLQGIDTDDETNEGLAWTMVIKQDSGRMSLTASGDQVVFTIFGSCTAL